MRGRQHRDESHEEQQDAKDARAQRDERAGLGAAGDGGPLEQSPLDDAYRDHERPEDRDDAECLRQVDEEAVGGALQLEHGRERRQQEREQEEQYRAAQPRNGLVVPRGARPAGEASQCAHHHALQHPCGHSQQWYRTQQCEPLPPEQP